MHNIQTSRASAFLAHILDTKQLTCKHNYKHLILRNGCQSGAQSYRARSQNEDSIWYESSQNKGQKGQKGNGK